MGLRFLTSGESHGKCLNAIIEGIGAGFEFDIDFINSELKARQGGIGRGRRMKIENDTAEIKSGVRFSKTMGAPICVEIKNKDWENWRIPMSVEKLAIEELDDNSLNELKNKKITNVRPGHADLAGAIKYNFDDIRNVLERSSARETTARVAVGAICQNILQNFDINFETKIISLGGKTNPTEFEDIVELAQNSGESLGGEFEIKITNMPVGLGSYVHWDKRLDGLLAQAVMSVPAVKSVEIGLGKESANLFGSKVHDEIFFENNQHARHTNNAGGIEGGMSNGEPIIVRAAMKPIPTLKKPLNSINFISKEPVKAHFERADVCATEACAVVAKNMTAFVILKAFFEKFGSDNFEEVKKNFEQRKK